MFIQVFRIYEFFHTVIDDLFIFNVYQTKSINANYNGAHGQRSFILCYLYLTGRGGENRHKVCCGKKEI